VARFVFILRVVVLRCAGRDLWA